MAADTILRARQLFQNGRYKETIRILESEIFHFRDNFNFYYLLGSACLFSGDINGASTYLDRANQMDPDHVNAKIGQAAINIYKQDIEKALKIYLDIIELEPGNKQALRAIKAIKKYTGSEDYMKFFNPKEIARFLPGVKKKFPWGILLTALALVILAFILIFTFNFPKKTQRLTDENFILPSERPELILLDGEYAFRFTEKEIKESFNRAKLYFNQYKDNRVRIEINRILHSNATMDVKKTVSLLIDQLKAPEFSNYSYEDHISLSDVRAHPLLYKGCYVIWEGKIGDIKISEQAIDFDLWVETANKFEGVVPVSLFFGEKLNNGDRLRVLGQIQIDAQEITLIGKKIHIKNLP